MKKTAHNIYIGSFFLIGIAVTIFLGYNGYSYYSAPLEERVFFSNHLDLKPSGIWGHAFGIIGTLMMIIGVAVYMLRKRVRYLMSFGYLKHWLEFHIFLCTLGPVLILYHTAFKFGGIVAVSFWSMAAVVISGVVGRFIYVQIPRSISGQELSLRELDDLNKDLNYKLSSLNTRLRHKIEEVSSPDKFKSMSFIKFINIVFFDYFTRKRLLNEISRELHKNDADRMNIKEVIHNVKLKLITSRRIGLLRIMHRLFRYWHIVHLPFAGAMFIIMIIHVIVTFTFGYKWIF